MSEMRYTGYGPLPAIAVEPRVRSEVRLQSSTAALDWVWQHKNAVWFAVLMAFIAIVHAYNMFNFPYYENDEGTYVSQAWAILHEGQLAPYTYWYDHAPAGWILIAGWELLTGGFHTFGTTAASGRAFMLVLHIASAALLYGIARTMSRRVWVATLAVLLFSLPAYALYFERRVLLDNIATFWILLTVYLLISGRLTLTRAWASALTFGIAALTKENMAFLLPALLALAYWRAHRSHRILMVAGWMTIVGSVVSLYILMAVIKGELFPTGTLLGGTAPHVSLLGTLAFQASRGKDGGLFDLHSGFWSNVRTWAQGEPLLVVGGSICAGISVALIKWYRAVGIFGLCTFLLWAFLARGGIVLGFYLVPSIPFLALNIALVLDVAIGQAEQFIKRQGYKASSSVAIVCSCIVSLACVVSLAIGYAQLPQANVLLPWTNTQAIAQAQATQWIEQYVSPDQTVVIDDAIWVDLHENHPLAHWYWKVDQDPAILNGVFHDNWRNIDYIVVSPQVTHDAQQNHLTLVEDALAHCTVVAHFDTGGWPISICKVENGRQVARVLLIPAQSARARRPASSAVAWRRAI